MIRNIVPFYLDTPIEAINVYDADVDGVASGLSSFVFIQNADTSSSTCNVNVGVRNSNGKPIKPGTLIRFIKLGDNDRSIVIVPEVYSTLTALGDYTLTTQWDSVTLMFKGPSAENKEGEWVLFGSDLAGAGSGDGWDGTTALTATGALTLTGGGEKLVFNGEADMEMNGSSYINLKAGSAPVYDQTTVPTATITNSTGGSTGTVSAATNSTDAAGTFTLNGAFIQGDEITVNYDSSPSSSDIYARVPIISNCGTSAFEIKSFGRDAFVLKVKSNFLGNGTNDFFTYITSAIK